MTNDAEILKAAQEVDAAEKAWQAAAAESRAASAAGHAADTKLYAAHEARDAAGKRLLELVRAGTAGQPATPARGREFI